MSAQIVITIVDDEDGTTNIKQTGTSDNTLLHETYMMLEIMVGVQTIINGMGGTIVSETCMKGVEG